VEEGMVTILMKLVLLFSLCVSVGWLVCDIIIIFKNTFLLP